MFISLQDNESTSLQVSANKLLKKLLTIHHALLIVNC